MPCCNGGEEERTPGTATRTTDRMTRPTAHATEGPPTGGSYSDPSRATPENNVSTRESSGWVLEEPPEWPVFQLWFTAERGVPYAEGSTTIAMVKAPTEERARHLLQRYADWNPRRYPNNVWLCPNTSVCLAIGKLTAFREKVVYVAEARSPPRSPPRF